MRGTTPRDATTPAGSATFHVDGGRARERPEDAERDFTGATAASIDHGPGAPFGEGPQEARVGIDAERHEVDARSQRRSRAAAGTGARKGRFYGILRVRFRRVAGGRDPRGEHDDPAPEPLRAGQRSRLPDGADEIAGAVGLLVGRERLDVAGGERPRYEEAGLEVAGGIAKQHGDFAAPIEGLNDPRRDLFRPREAAGAGHRAAAIDDDPRRSPAGSRPPSPPEASAAARSPTKPGSVALAAPEPR